MMPRKDYDRLIDFWNILGESGKLFKTVGEREPSAAILITFDDTKFEFGIRSVSTESYGQYYIRFNRFPGFRMFGPSNVYNIDELCQVLESWIFGDINKYLEESGMPKIILTEEIKKLREEIAKEMLSEKKAFVSPVKAKNTHAWHLNLYNLIVKNPLSTVTTLISIASAVFYLGMKIDQIRYDQEKTSLDKANAKLEKQLESSDLETSNLEQKIKEQENEIKDLFSRNTLLLKQIDKNDSIVRARKPKSGGNSTPTLQSKYSIQNPELHLILKQKGHDCDRISDTD